MAEPTEKSEDESDTETYSCSIFIVFGIFFFGLLIPLCYLGWRPTTQYLAANSHLNESDLPLPSFIEFTGREPLQCERNLSIGMVYES